MRIKVIGLVAASLAAVVAIAYGYRLLSYKPEAYIDPSDMQLVRVGQQIYNAQCASCHGANLEGEPNWRQRKPNGRLPAPPHDVSGHTWHHPDQVLFDMVKRGLVPGVTAPPGYESDMPAYGAILTDEEIRASLAYIKSTWPQKAQEVQQQLTLEYQKVR